MVSYMVDHYYPDWVIQEGENGVTFTESQWAKVDVFQRMFDIANLELVMRFQDQLFVQRKGLAMGVASSPDIANLYGAYFEESIVKEDKDILFYRRYIDDVLGLVVADTPEDAMKIAAKIQFEGCEIVWTVPGTHTVFLDMSIYLDEGRPHYKVYKKAQNNHERIPWSSHHPIDVKRGTFIGEITRMATLSSRKMHYEAALQDLQDLYVARGYPPHVLSGWMKKFANLRWQNRLADRKESPGGLHVLKTVFNPVWDYVDMSTVHNKIQEEWRKELLPSETSSLRQLSLWDVGVERVTMAPPRRSRRRKITRVGAGFSVVQEIVSEPSSDEEGDHPPAPMRRRIGNEPSSNLGRDVDALSSLMNQRMIVSRRRTTTLGDLTNVWRKTVLEYQERVPLAEDIVRQFW
jgi:hypothetical protein